MIKSSPVDRFWCLRYLKNCTNLPNMMGSFASSITNSLVAKIGTKYLAISCSVYRIWINGQIFMFKVSKQPYQSTWHDRIIGKWCHCLPGGQKCNLKIISAVWRATGLKFIIQSNYPQINYWDLFWNHSE